MTNQNKNILGTEGKKPWEIEVSTDVSDLIALAKLYVPPKKEKPNLENKVKTPKVTSIDDYWLIKNVKYLGKTQNYKLKKEVLPKKTQAFHLEDAVRVGESDFHIVDKPLEYAIMIAIYNSEDNKEKQEIQEFFKESFIKYWLSSGTDVEYNPKGKDIVNHNLSKQSKEANIVGPVGFMNDLKDKEYSEALLGEENPEVANKIFKWFTGKDLYIFRLNSKPQQKEKRVVGSGSVGGGSYLDALGDPSDRDRCLGVCVAD